VQSEREKERETYISEAAMWKEKANVSEEGLRERERERERRRERDRTGLGPVPISSKVAAITTAERLNEQIPLAQS